MTVEERVPFYGRAAALHELVGHADAVRDTGQGRMLAIDGRRQVGKSRLLTEFVERSRLPYLYYTAPESTDLARHLQAWVATSAHSTRPLPDSDTLWTKPPRDWADVFGRLAIAARAAPGVVVLDDFDLAGAADPDLESTLATYWQRHLRGCPLLLVLVGRRTARSPAGSDPRASGKPLAHHDPLARHTQLMTVAPLNPAECAHALGSGSTAVAAFDTHLVTGGSPRLVAGCAKAGGPAEFIRTQLRDEYSDLAVMAQRFVAAEVAESASARLVLAAIGSDGVGLTSFSRIVAQLPTSGVTAQTAATRALKLLTGEKQVVAVQIPVGAPANTKLRRYHLDDTYLRFWHSFVQPHLADIARGRPDIAVAAFDAGWDAWRAAAIGPLVQKCLQRLTLTMPGLSRVETVGGWWNRDGYEYDAVFASARGQPVVAVGAIAWREHGSFRAAELPPLDEARDVVPGAARAKLAVICPAGVERGVGVDLVIDPDTLLAAW